MKFGEFLRTQRETKELKQPEAAQEIGIEQSYLSKLENNKAIPSADVFDRLMTVYQFDVKQIGELVSDSELEKLKDIVLVRDFIITHRKKGESVRRYWLIAGLISLVIGAGLLFNGIAQKGTATLTYIYESKGIINQGEPAYLFAEMPTYRSFQSRMTGERSRNELTKSQLFSRLDYKQITTDFFNGNFFDKKVETGSRRYYLLKQKETRVEGPFRIGVSFGAMFIVAGLGAFFISRRW